MYGRQKDGDLKIPASSSSTMFKPAIQGVTEESRTRMFATAGETLAARFTFQADEYFRSDETGSYTTFQNSREGMMKLKDTILERGSRLAADFGEYIRILRISVEFIKNPDGKAEVIEKYSGSFSDLRIYLDNIYPIFDKSSAPACK